MKRIIIYLMLILFPINVKAITENIVFDCESTTIKAGDTLKCTIDGYTDKEVSAVSVKLQLGNGLSLVNVVTDSTWEGDGDGGNIQLYTENNKTGKFPIAVFTVKSESITDGLNTDIKLIDVTLSDADFNATNFDINPLNIRIASTINTLNDLIIDDLTINGFESSKNDYNLVVDSTRTSINIDATPTDDKSKISGNVGTKKLKYGINNFYINVMSESGDYKKYTLSVNKPEVRELRNLLINNVNLDLKSGVYEYNYTVKNEITNVDLKATLINETYAKFVDGYGERKIEKLEEGDNEVLLKVKDINNEELTYKITINRLSVQANSENTEQNPSTGGNFKYVIFIVIAILAIKIFLKIRKYSKFPKNINN